MRNRLLGAAATSILAAAAATTALCGPAAAAQSVAPVNLAALLSAKTTPEDAAKTATPIKHLVIIFNENFSFDYYFATYPQAANPPGEPAFTAMPGTPIVDNLLTALTSSPTIPTRPIRTMARTPPSRSGSTETRPSPPTRTTKIPKKIGLSRRQGRPVS